MKASARAAGGSKTFQNTASRPPGPQHLGGLGRARYRVHPVPGLPGNDGVERPSGRIPRFERRHLNLEALLPGELGHSRVDLDAEQPAPGRSEGSSGDPGADAHVEHGGPGLAAMIRFTSASG